MRLKLGLQSETMYRNGKLFHGSRTIHVLLSLIIYVATMKLLLNVEGAQTPPTPREVMEAQKTVGRFLRDEAGPTWLSNLSMNRSSPLTTLDLMNAILAATKSGDEVWRAASILIEALKSQNGGSNLIMGQTDNWKDLIANIELQDDIICLYRKSTNETTKKAEDWQKFLMSVSPGYTIHLAIDTGRKYVICLKKIVVPETTVVENATMKSSTIGVSSTARAHDAPETTGRSTTKEEKSSTIPTVANDKNLSKPVPATRRDGSQRKCHKKEVLLERDAKMIGNDDNGVFDREQKQSDSSSNNRRGIGENFYTDLGSFSGKDYVNPNTLEPPSTPESSDLPYTWINQCKRPIILIVPAVNNFQGYRPNLLPISKARLYSSFLRNILARASKPREYDKSTIPSDKYFRPAILPQQRKNDKFLYPRYMNLKPDKMKQLEEPANDKTKLSFPIGLYLRRILQPRSDRKSQNDRTMPAFDPSKFLRESPTFLGRNVGKRAGNVINDPKLSVAGKSVFRPFWQRPRSSTYDGTRTRLPVANHAFRPAILRRPVQYVDRLDPRLLQAWRWRQRPFLFPAFCTNPTNHRHPYCASSLLGFPIVRWKHRKITSDCQKACERPIKLQVVIDGNVQKSARVSVHSNDDEHLEIVEPTGSELSSGARTMHKSNAIEKHRRSEVGSAKDRVDATTPSIKATAQEKKSTKINENKSTSSQRLQSSVSVKTNETASTTINSTTVG